MSPERGPEDDRPAAELPDEEDTDMHISPITIDAPIHDARILVGDGGSARIVLDGAVYTLRITRQGKLILTK